MFCPLCKSESNPWSNRCPQCGATLLAYIPANESAAGKVPADSEGRELLWSGLSPKIHAAICRGLADAGIEYKVSEKSFGFLPATVQSASFIWISRVDRAKALQVMDNLPADSKPSEPLEESNLFPSAKTDPFRLGRKPYRLTLLGEGEGEYALAESGDSNAPALDEISKDFEPDDATTEVWSGDDSEKADYLKLSLTGVGIGCALRVDGGGKPHILVLPAQEARAREIVRQVVEGSPPQ